MPAVWVSSLNAAPGIDGQTAAEYAENLVENLRDLHERLKTRQYRATPIKRVWIPKDDGSQRPIGILILEDKIVQKAVAMVLEAVYEEDFLDFSYGFRPGRSAHDALDRVWEGLMGMGGGWVLEVDIRSYFDTLDHGCLRQILDQRVLEQQPHLLQSCSKDLPHSACLFQQLLQLPALSTPVLKRFNLAGSLAQGLDAICQCH